MEFEGSNIDIVIAFLINNTMLPIERALFSALEYSKRLNIRSVSISVESTLFFRNLKTIIRERQRSDRFLMKHLNHHVYLTRTFLIFILTL